MCGEEEEGREGGGRKRVRGEISHSPIHSSKGRNGISKTFFRKKNADGKARKDFSEGRYKGGDGFPALCRRLPLVT